MQTRFVSCLTRSLKLVPMIAPYLHLAAIFVSSSTERLNHTTKPFKARYSKLIKLAALLRSVWPTANNEVVLMVTQLKEFDASDT